MSQWRRMYCVQSTGITDTRFNIGTVIVKRSRHSLHSSYGLLTPCPPVGYIFCTERMLEGESKTVCYFILSALLSRTKALLIRIESFVPFESFINLRRFLQTLVILFPNKIDVFKSKLPKVCFTELAYYSCHHLLANWLCTPQEVLP
jgi:hypothetical protein